MAFRNRIVRISQLTADTLIGAAIATAATGRRWVMDSTVANELRAYTAQPNETAPARVLVNRNVDTGGFLEIRSPELSTTVGAPGGSGSAALNLEARPDQAAGSRTQATLSADLLRLIGAAYLIGALEVSGAVLLDTSLSVAGGRAIKGWDWNHYTGTTDAAGSITVPHALGVAPTDVFATPGNVGGGVRIARCDTYTAASFVVTFLTSAGAVPAVGTSVQTRYWALVG